MANPFLMAILNLSHGAVLKEKGPKHVLGKYLRPSSHPWLPKFAPQRPVSQFGYENFFFSTVWLLQEICTNWHFQKAVGVTPWFLLRKALVKDNQSYRNSSAVNKSGK